MAADFRPAKSGTSRTSSAGPGTDGRNAFLGRWKLEGRQLEGPVGKAAAIRAEETYEWLTGRSFVIHRFEGRVGDAEAACIEIIGRDPKSGSYPTHTFYDNGERGRRKPDAALMTRLSDKRRPSPRPLPGARGEGADGVPLTATGRRP